MKNRAFIAALAAAVVLSFALGIFSLQPAAAWFCPMFSMDSLYVEEEQGAEETVVRFRFFEGGGLFEFIKILFR